MKYVNLADAHLLAGLAMLLESHGIDTEDLIIARTMEAPYMILRENGRYLAGASLYRPDLLAIYLRPLGFELRMTHLPRKEAMQLLRTLPQAICTVSLDRSSCRLAVYEGFADGRYHFHHLKPRDSNEPEQDALTGPALNRRLPDEVTIYTLESCPPQPVSVIPYLKASLQNIDDYRLTLREHQRDTVTREQFYADYWPLLKPLAHDLLPLVSLIGDKTFANELTELNHEGRHVFYHGSPDVAVINDQIHWYSIKCCLDWLQENLLDRLYSLGESDRAMKRFWYDKHK